MFNFKQGRRVMRTDADRLRRGLLLGAGLSTLSVPRGTRAQARPHYDFSPVNQHGLELTAAYWNPILEHVSAASGIDLRLRVARTSAETTAMVLAQKVDFAFTNHLFSPERDKLGWEVLARRDLPAVRGQLIVMASSPWRDLASLARQTVAFPGPEALVSYKVPYAHLLGLGIPVQVVFGGNTDGALAQLRLGKAAAAGVNSQLAEGFARRENLSFRVLWQSEAFNELALMASPRVPRAHQAAVAKAFIGIAGSVAGQALLQSVNALVKQPVAGFRKASDDDYEAYRNFYRHAPAELR